MAPQTQHYYKLPCEVYRGEVCSDEKAESGTSKKACQLDTWILDCLQRCPVAYRLRSPQNGMGPG